MGEEEDGEGEGEGESGLESSKKAEDGERYCITLTRDLIKMLTTAETHLQPEVTCSAVQSRFQ